MRGMLEGLAIVVAFSGIGIVLGFSTGEVGFGMLAGASIGAILGGSHGIRRSSPP